jgi:hypothetical protein
VSVPEWTLQISYFGLVPWLLVATPVVFTSGRLLALLRRDTIVQAHVAFIAIQLIGYVNGIATFGADGVVAGAYILAVCTSFLYMYVFGLRIGEFHSVERMGAVSSRCLGLLVGAMLPTLLLAILQLLTGTGRDVGDGISRAYGGTSSPNVLGALLLIFIGAVAWNGRNRLTGPHMLLLALSLALFVACFSMSGVAAIVFAGLVYFLARARATGRVRVRLSWIVIALVGLYVLLALAGSILSARVDELQHKDNSLAWRLRTWATYFELLSDTGFLLFGGGLGYDHQGMEQPHNEWLRVTIETGLLGLGFFIWVWVRLFKALRQVMALPVQLLQVRATGLFACTAGLTLWASADSVIRTAPSALLVWAMAGLLIGSARSYRVAQTEEVSPDLGIGFAK